MNDKLADLLLTKALRTVNQLKTEHAHSKNHTAWLQSTHFDLSEILGVDNPIVQNFFNISYNFRGSIAVRQSEAKAEIERVKREAYLKGLEEAEGVLLSAKRLIDFYGLEKVRDTKPSLSQKEAKNIFIAHGKNEIVLKKIENYVRALGLNPLVVRQQPSGGKAIDDLVDNYIKISECAIILGTCDDKVGDKYQARPNVFHEIGKSQEKLQNRLIYLFEEGCQIPSNVVPKVYERFTEKDLSPALNKIAKELRAFGIINT